MRIKLLFGLLLVSLTSFGQYTKQELSDGIRLNIRLQTASQTRLANMFDSVKQSVPLLRGSYSNPTWITSLGWSKISSTPTTLNGYGITDPVVLTSGSYANPSWITSLGWSKISGAPGFITNSYYNFSSGIKESGGSVKLGGSLNENLDLDNNGYGISIGNLLDANLTINSSPDFDNSSIALYSNLTQQNILLDNTGISLNSNETILLTADKDLQLSSTSGLVKLTKTELQGGSHIISGNTEASLIIDPRVGSPGSPVNGGLWYVNGEGFKFYQEGTVVALPGAYTFQNGLVESGGTVGLGGSFTVPIYIDNGGNDLTIAGNGGSMTFSDGLGTYWDSFDLTANNSFKAGSQNSTISLTESVVDVNSNGNFSISSVGSTTLSASSGHTSITNSGTGISITGSNVDLNNRIDFATATTLAPIVIKPAAAPSSPTNGSIYYENGVGFKFYEQGSIKTLGGGGTGTVTSVGLTQPASGITVSGSPITTSGNITLALANDLAAVEGLSSTGIVRRTATDTWSAGTAVSLTSEVTGLLPYANIANGSALSVVGRSANSSGVNASIAAGTDGHVLRRNGTTLDFGSIDLSNSSTVGSSILPIANGGTGSSTQNFVDLSTSQTISGDKTFNGITEISSGSNGLRLYNSAGTFYTSITSGASGGNRNISIPNANGSLMVGTPGTAGNVLLSSGGAATSDNNLSYTSSTLSTPNITVATKINVTTGTNKAAGTSTLAAGTVTVSTTAVTASSIIILTPQNSSGTVGHVRITAKTTGTSFVITSSSNTDTSTIGWLIIN